MQHTTLALQDLQKTFGGNKPVHALQGVSFQVHSGEIFSLLGPNGAGKTTLIKCVLGIVFPTSGKGEVLGYELGSVKAKEKIGYLPENHRYPLHLTGEQVLSYFGKLSGLEGQQLQKEIDHTLELVGMRDWRKTRIQKYSKGMMQRLGLAQAMLNNPELIMLDEPTDGVDPVGRKEIRDILLHLKEKGKTIFLNSHLLSEVERISDQVAIMDHGKVIREGTVDELTLSKSSYTLRVDRESVNAAESVLQLKPQENTFAIHVDTIEELNATIDNLRARSILIEAVQPQRSSLEDLFIQLIGSSDLTRQ